MNMPAIDMIIIIGKIRNIGFLAISRPPTVIINAIMPTTATIMTNGISFISQVARDVPRNLGRRSQIDFATRHPRWHHPQAAHESLRVHTLLPEHFRDHRRGRWRVSSVLTNPIAQEADCSLTLPPSLSDLDPDAESEHELSRLTLVVGSLHIDVGLPADVGIAAYINDVIDIANEQIAVREPSSDVEFDETDGKWTLARLDGDPIDPHRSLSEAGVYDGELLMIREVGQPVSPPLFDDVDDALVGEKSAVRAWMAREARRADLLRRRPCRHRHARCFGAALGR